MNIVGKEFLMKRVAAYLLGLAFLSALLPLRAEAPWGILEDAVENKIKFPYVIDRVLANEPVRYAVSPGVTPQEEQLFTDSVRKWHQTTLGLIQARHRTNEFQDIIPLLKREIKFQKTSSAHADITISVENDYCDKAAGCFYEHDKKIVIATGARQDFASVMLHEVGHYWGLGDQYKKSRHNSSPIYSSPTNTVEGSVMNASDLLTCDDNDGFINLIDLRLYQTRGKFPARATKGWWSLCKKTKNFYQEAKTVNRREDTIPLADSRTDQLTSYDKRGNIREMEHLTWLDQNPMPLFAVSKGDKITRDSRGRVIRITSDKPTPLCPLVGKKSVRTFQYNYQGDGHSYEILINCAGQKQTYSFPVVKSGDWTLSVMPKPSGEARAYRTEFPLEGTLATSVTFKNYRVTQIETSAGDLVQTSRGPKYHRVSLKRAGTVYHAEVEGYQQLGYRLTDKDFQHRLLFRTYIPSHWAVLLEVKDAYDQVAAYVNNFYKYFYQPLLGIAPEQKAQQQVRQQLQVRR